VPLDSIGLSIVSADECRSLLRSEIVGRVVFTHKALPAALPVNYRVIREDVVFRTAEGGKLDAALDHTIVAFEVDNVDATNRTGWSVLVIGEGRVLTEPNELAEAEKANLQAWTPGPSPHFVAIRIDRITGRRIG
jgi:uncharacterized protein